MMFILTQEEMDNFASVEELENSEKATEYLRDKFIGHNCIHHKNNNSYFKYCDDCPINLNNLTKNGLDLKVAKKVCDLKQIYSK